MKAKEEGASCLEPKSKRRLIHRDEAGIKGDKEEVVPAGEHVLYSGGVVGDTVSDVGKVEQVKEGGQA
jgi:hypothetical protein